MEKKKSVKWKFRMDIYRGIGFCIIFESDLVGIVLPFFMIGLEKENLQNIKN